MTTITEALDDFARRLLERQQQEPGLIASVYDAALAEDGRAMVIVDLSDGDCWGLGFDLGCAWSGELREAIEGAFAARAEAILSAARPESATLH